MSLTLFSACQMLPAETSQAPAYPAPGLAAGQSPSIPEEPVQKSAALETPQEISPGATPQIAPAQKARPAASLRLIYAETDPQTSITTIYSALPADPLDRLKLASFNHREGYPPNGRVSPDGSRLAVLVIPPDVSEGAARRDGGQVWIVPLDGSPPEKLHERTGYIAQWSPDGRDLIAGRYVDAPDTAEKLVPNQIEILDIQTDTGAEQVIRTGDGSTALRPLGWTADSSKFLTADARPDGWHIDAWERGTGAWKTILELPARRQVKSISLAPSGSSLLLTEISDGAVSLTLQPLDGGPQKELARSSPPADNTNAFAATWNFATGELLIFSRGGPEANREVLRYAPGADRAAQAESVLPAVQQNPPGLVPLGWSPDGAWLVYRDYQDSSLPLYLQQASQGGLVSIPSTTSGANLTFYGWTTR